MAAKLPRRAAPVFVQVFGLALLCLVLGQAANFAVLLAMPEPPPMGFSVAEAAAALTGKPVITRDGKTLRARVQDLPPDLREGAPTRHMESMVRTLLAQTLGVERERVRAAMRLGGPVPPWGGHGAVPSRFVESRMRIIVHMGPEGLPPPPSPALPWPPGSPREPRGLDVQHDELVFPPFAAALRRGDGRWVVVEPFRPLISPWQARLAAWLLLCVLLATPFVWWVARRLSRPIHAFAQATERLGSDPNTSPLPVEGPLEVRQAATAFNLMQTRLQKHIADRISMVAAIAHDLRTPLMRLRFRVEAAPDAIRDKAIADIEQMDAMISAALTFVRGQRRGADFSPVDLTGLLEAVVADMQDMGLKAAMVTSPALIVTGSAVDLRRLLANLLENAVKFGGGAEASAAREGSLAVIRVRDHGPGVPEDALEAVFEPFARLDSARPQGGFGLGLSTARAIARAHGGEITLANAGDGGLIVTCVLPAEPEEGL